MSNERKNWLLLHRLFLFCFGFFFVLIFFLFGIVSFVTMIPDKFQFQCQVRLSQINVIVSIRLKLKLYAVFIEWGSRIDFLFMGWQDIVNYWDFPPGFWKTATNIWYQKLLDMLNEKCLQNCLSATDWFVLQILLEWFSSHSFSCYQYPTVFSGSAFPHSLQLSWIFFYH